MPTLNLPKKFLIFAIAAFITNSIFASEGMDFEHFAAPKIIGAYYSEWSPLGISRNGLDFGIGFYIEGGNQTNPIDIWIDNKTKLPVVVNSIAAANYVISDFLDDGVNTEDTVKTARAIDIARKTFSIKTLSLGQTGFSLRFDTRGELLMVVSRLEKAGLDDRTGKLLLKLGDGSVDNFNLHEKRWEASWCEVDLLGGIEKVTLRGSLSPFQVVSVTKDALYGAGAVNTKLLRRDILFNLDVGQ